MNSYIGFLSEKTDYNEFVLTNKEYFKRAIMEAEACYEEEIHEACIAADRFFDLWMLEARAYFCRTLFDIGRTLAKLNIQVWELEELLQGYEERYEGDIDHFVGDGYFEVAGELEITW